MKPAYLICAAIVLVVSACSKGPADQRADIREAKRKVIEQADGLANDLTDEGRFIVRADGAYIGCTVGWSDAGLEYDAELRLDEIDEPPRDQVRTFADQLKQDGWNDVEYIEENNAIDANFDGVQLRAQPVDPNENAPGARSLRVSFTTIGCLPDPDDGELDMNLTREPLRLSVPVGPPDGSDLYGDPYHDESR